VDGQGVGGFRSFDRWVDVVVRTIQFGNTGWIGREGEREGGREGGHTNVP